MKHLSKEAIAKSSTSKDSYRHTGSDEDYAIYKEALNQATLKLEIRREAMNKK